MTYSSQHLAYCSNVHPGEQLDDVINNIKLHFEQVRQRRNLDAMASGLWLSNAAAISLVTDTKKLLQFKQQLKRSGVLLTSLNGFPFGNFHQDVVKTSVYHPCWAQSERLDYSQHLATILAACLPATIDEGCISTLPLGYRLHWTEDHQLAAILNLITLAQFLEKLEVSSGKRICFGIEMEPDCALQSTEQFVSFFKQDLLPKAETMGISPQLILRYIGCCFDTCHQAVMNEDIGQSLTQIQAAGIHICKIQISNAVTATLTQPRQITQLTAMFSDIKFLHQTQVLSKQQTVASLSDLSTSGLTQAFNTYPSPLAVNIHYHIPIHQNQCIDGFISSTQSAITQTLLYLAQHSSCRPKLEIETYTWLNFLNPNEAQQHDLILGLVAEFNWLEMALIEQGLLVNKLAPAVILAK